MNLLSYDGLLARGVRAIWRHFVISMCFVLCCLPVVTIGAASTAMCSIHLPSSDDSGVLKKYFSAFKNNFSQATLIWLIFLGPLLLLCASLYLSFMFTFPGSYVMRIMTPICSSLFMSTISYVFPLQARYENPIRTTIRNAFVLGIFAFLPGLLMSAITLLPIILFLLNLDIFIYVLPLWQVAGFSLTAMINSAICMSVFSRLDPVPQSSDESPNTNTD